MNFQALHKKWSFPLRISSVNATKSAVCCGFGRIYWRNPQWKTSFFVQWRMFYDCVITFLKSHSLLWTNKILIWKKMFLWVFNLPVACQRLFAFSWNMYIRNCKYSEAHLRSYQTSMAKLRISSVNVTKSAGNCGFGHIYWRNP